MKTHNNKTMNRSSETDGMIRQGSQNPTPATNTARTRIQSIFKQTMAAMVFVALIFQSSVQAATVSSWYNGGFSSWWVWTCFCYPATSDDIVISSGNTIYLVSNTVVNSMEIQAGAELNLQGYRLTVTGDFINNGTISGNNRLEIQGNNNTVSGNGNWDNFSGDVYFYTGDHAIAAEVRMTLSGNIQVNSNTTVFNHGFVSTTSSVNGSSNYSSVWNNEASSTLSVSRNLLSTGRLNADAMNNTVIYNRTGSGSQNIKTPVNGRYYHLTIDGNNTSSNKILTSSIEVAGNITLDGSSLDASGSNYDISVGGNWNNTGGNFRYRSNTVIFDGSQQFIYHISGEQFYDVVLGNSTTVTLRSGITVNHDFTIGSGSTMDVNDTTQNTMTLYRNFTNNGTFTARNGEVVLKGNGSRSLKGGTDFYNLTVNISGNATMGRGTFGMVGTLRLNSGQLVTNDSLVFISNAAGTARIDEITWGSISGKITMQRYISNGVEFWRMLASAVSNATINDWNDHFSTTGFSGSNYPTSTFKSIQRYDESTAGIKDNGYYGVSSVNDVIQPGTGYFVWSRQNTGKGAFTIDVKGNPNTGNKVLPVSYTVSGGSTEDGWNLVGNPYPSAIDWNASGWTKTRINNAIYVYDPVNKQYASYVGGVSTNGGSNIIPSSQAFWVQANGSNPVLTARESVKTAQEHNFMRTGMPDDNLLIRIVGANKIEDETLIQVDENATNEFDSDADARKIFSAYPGAPGLATFIQQTDYSINTIPTPDSNLVIALQAKVSVKGMYTLTLDFNNNGNSFSCLKFRDRFTNVEFNITNDTTYSAFLYDTTKTSRFEIVVGPSMDIQVTKPTCSYTDDARIELQGLGNGPWNYSWADEDSVTFGEIKNSFSRETIEGLKAGKYSVAIGNSGICGQQTVVVSIDNPAPVIAAFALTSDTVSLAGTGAVMATNMSVNATSYTWNFGDDQTSSEMNAQHQYTKAGNYEITLVAMAGQCSDTSAANVYVVEGTTAIETVNTEDALKVFAFNRIIHVRGTIENSANMEVTVFDVQGRKVFANSYAGSDFNETIDATNMPKVVIVRVQYGEKVQSTAVMVE